MLRRMLLLAVLVLSPVPAWLHAQSVQPFDAGKLLKTGDTLHYGSYNVIRLGDGLYQISDPGDSKARKGGAVGTDMYLILGNQKALLIDLGNNYISGYEKDAIAPRPNAAAELLAVVDALVGKLPLEITLTHAHPDHDGMTAAFAGRKITLWMPKGEDLEGPRTQHQIDPAVYTVFDFATKSFDLGGGRVVQPLLLRGHTNGCAVYLLPSDSMLFTGDCLGFGLGQLYQRADQVRVWAEDSARLVSTIRAELTPFQRYALRVFTGHNANTPIPGFVSPTRDRLDLAYLDWRFVQDQALCAAAILKGQWLIPDSGLRLLEVVGPGGKGTSSIFTYGIGAVRMPVDQAYIAAGIKKLDESPRN